MKWRAIKLLSLLIGITAVLLVISGLAMTAWHTSATPDFQAGENQAPVGDKPDTRRDVFIAARNALPAPALAAGEWVNSEPLTLKSLHGRVVVVDFWTFGCYNCRNTLPTLKRWDTSYREQGLTIIGVHSPEFDREKDVNNVRREVRSLGIRYPVVTDNDYETWRAYGVRAWPTTVILDEQGRIRWTHIGEGMYSEMEAVIKKLLAEADADKSTGKGETKAILNGSRSAILTEANKLAKREELTMTGRVIKSDEEWQKQLTTEQFYVMRRRGQREILQVPFTTLKRKAFTSAPPAVVPFQFGCEV